MRGKHLREARKLKGWSQDQAARRLGISQAYLSLLEKGERPLPEKLANKMVRVLDLSEAHLPVNQPEENPIRLEEVALAGHLAVLGYPHFSHLRSKRRKRNPAVVLLAALGQDDLDSRLVEALPWIVIKYTDLDWAWLVRSVKVNDLQNRLGFIVSLVRRLAESHGENEKAARLAEVESVLERARLLREDTLCHNSLTEPEKKWLRKHRSSEARHWRLLTDLTLEQYADAA